MLPFWERVKKLLRSQKLSQKDFACLRGINYSSFRYWMCYGLYPDAKTAYDMAISLGVSLEYLLTGIDGNALKIREQEILARKSAAIRIKKMLRKIDENADLLR